MDRALMQKSIREIEAGDYLAEDALSEKGEVVLAKGTALEPAHAGLLMENRIFTVKVGTKSEVVSVVIGVGFSLRWSEVGFGKGSRGR